MKFKALIELSVTNFTIEEQLSSGFFQMEKGVISLEEKKIGFRDV